MTKVRGLRRPVFRYRHIDKRTIAQKRIKDTPVLIDVIMRAREILESEEGIMLDAKLRHVLQQDQKISFIVEKALADNTADFWDDRYSIITRAISAGDSLGYFERVSSEEDWFPRSIRLPGITRTKPKAQYLDLDVD